MAATFNLRIVTPDGQVLNDHVEFVIMPGEAGELGALANHAPLIASLKTGVLRYTKEGFRKKVAVSGGFAEVAANKVVVLADTAEPGEAIDLQRAVAAKERAEKRLATPSGDIDLLRAEHALRKAMNRIAAADKEDRRA